jgi:hypothetical protein
MTESANVCVRLAPSTAFHSVVSEESPLLRGFASGRSSQRCRDVLIGLLFVIGTREDVAKGRTHRTATVGVAEHGNSAALVTVAPGGECLGRRRIDLTDRGLPTHPHHHEGSWAVGPYPSIPGAGALSVADAVALVERVRALRCARRAREPRGAGRGSTMPIASNRDPCVPKLPPTTEERIAEACGSVTG